MTQIKQEYIEIDKGLAIYKLRQSKNWYIYLWDHEDKVAIRRSLKISDKKEAYHQAIFLKMALAQNLKGSVLSKPSKKLNTVINELLSKYRLEQSKLEKKTNKYKELNRYISILICLSEKYGGVNIKELDYAHLLSFYQDYENKISKTQLRYMNLAIKKLFNYCLTKRFLKTIPPIPSIKTKVSEKGKYFGDADYKTIINRLKNRSRKAGVQTENNYLLHQAFVFCTLTGIRPGKELSNIQCSDISVENIQGKNYWLCQIKGGKIAEKDGVKRKIILPVKAISCVKSIMQDSGVISGIVDAHMIAMLRKYKDRYIFRRKSGKEIDFSTLFSELKKEISDDLLEKDIVMYSCRHTFITNQLKRGANINIVAKHSGTSVEMIEKHYNHLLSIMKPAELLDTVYNVERDYQKLPVPQSILDRLDMSEEQYIQMTSS